MKSKTLTLLMFFLIITGNIIAQNIPKGIPNAFKTGNVQLLGEYMEEKVFLVIPGLKKQLTRQETKEQLTLFFSANKPVDFKTIHQSEQNNSGYMIGKLITENQEFRVHILMKITDKKYYINQLRIENF